MAPELVGGDAGDARSDLWALGVLLYEMLAGERPFHHQHDVALMHAILHHDPVRPSLLRSGIEPRLEQLILTLLARDPRARPDTADRVHNALSRLDRQQSADATPATPPRRRARRTAAVVATIAVLLLALGTWFGQRERARDAGPRIVAVLPFLTDDADLDAAIIGAALADAVANRLARLASVAAPDGRSVQRYSLAGTEAENTRHIPTADAVVTGTIERSNDDLAVRIEISDARWRRSSTYGFTVARGDLHTALPLLLREIASALRLELTREERTLLASLPAASAEAWELYLRGRAIELLHVPPDSALALERMRQAQAYYVRARELDSDFALARARLAEVHTQLAQTYDTTFDRREQVRLEAEAALRLDPGLPEAHIALRYYYLRLGDYARADAQLQRAMEAAPNRSDLRLAHISRLRDLGHWNEAADELENAIRLDPRNTLVLRNAAVTYSRLRRYEDGIAAWDRLIALDPGDALAKAIRGNQYLRLGIIDSLAATAARLTSEQDENGIVTFTRYNALRVQRRHADVLAVLDSARLNAVGDDMFYRPIVLLRALTLDAMGDAVRARAAYEAASALLESSVRARPRDARLRIALGLAYAGLGRKKDAMAETRTAMELSPITSSTIGATAVRGDAVEVFIKAGEHDEAIRLIERLLAMPAGREISVPLLRIDPIYDPLRGDRRFEELLVRFNRS
jgi:tetratricopeptide (TPR) repeat protein/TolB-like protein